MMPLIDDADVQVHLPVDKLKVENVPDDLAKCKLDAERIVRGYLAGVVDSAVLATWATPDTTPETIRAIAGRFCAALIYRTRYSENRLGDPEFAQNKYNEAMSMLMDVIAGNLPIDAVIIGTNFDNAWFWPNDTTDPPKFTMADQY
jgi:phage gp36-like protein